LVVTAVVVVSMSMNRSVLEAPSANRRTSMHGLALKHSTNWWQAPGEDDLDENGDGVDNIARM
jgi:hypothetical protein